MEQQALIMAAKSAERRRLANLTQAVCPHVRKVSTPEDAWDTLSHEADPPGVLVLAFGDRIRAEILMLARVRSLPTWVPVLLVAAPQAEPYVPLMQHLGVRQVLYPPLNDPDFGHALRAALDETPPDEATDPPPLTAYEQRTRNLSALAKRLNQRVQCGAGKRRVLVQSFITGHNRKTPPRVALRCPLRTELGLQPYVYCEHIRDVCCAAPQKCVVLRAYQALHGRKVA